jgi:hypothetical protein
MSHSRNRAFEKRQKEAEERLKREVEEKLKPKENRPNNWFFGLVPLLTKETERAASKDSNPDTADNGAAADTNAGAEGEEDLGMYARERQFAPIYSLLWRPGGMLSFNTACLPLTDTVS